jgi:hypothetical protein
MTGYSSPAKVEIAKNNKVKVKFFSIKEKGLITQLARKKKYTHTVMTRRSVLSLGSQKKSYFSWAINSRKIRMERRV